MADDIAVIEAQLEAMEEGKDFFSDQAEILGFEGGEEGGNIAFKGKFKLTSSDGTVMMWNREDGTPVPVKRSRAAWTLKNKRHLTLQKPNVTRPEGTAYCFLHPEFPEAAEVRAAGISRKCKRTVPLATDMDAESHGQYHHKREWAAWQNYLARRQEQVTEQRQERLIEAMLAGRGGAQVEPPIVAVGSGGAGGSATDVQWVASASTDSPASPTSGAVGNATFTCECGKTYNKANGLKLHKRMHCPLKVA